MKTRRTIPGTVGPSGAYSVSMFADHPEPPAPLAMFDPSAFVDEPAALVAVPVPCPACGRETAARRLPTSDHHCSRCRRMGWTAETFPGTDHRDRSIPTRMERRPSD